MERIAKIVEMNEEGVMSFGQDEIEKAFLNFKKCQQMCETEGVNLYEGTGKIVIYYNQACCYQRLGMLKECLDSLKKCVQILQSVFSDLKISGNLDKSPRSKKHQKSDLKCSSR